MDWTRSVVQIIELNTFSNIWYWMVVVVTWALASNWLIGVPFDMLFRARRIEDEPIDELETLVTLQARRLTRYYHSFGPTLIGLIAFFLSGVAMMGFYYGLELGQGLFVLFAPLCLIGLINLRLALQLSADPLHGRPLVKRLFFVRLWTQVIAMVTLFFTAMYGMYYSLSQMYLF